MSPDGAGSGPTWSRAVGPRHVATAAAALLLLTASRLPLTGRGVGSAIAAIDALSLASGVSDDVVRTASNGLAAVLALGLVLGITVVVPGRIARTIWTIAAVVVLATGLAGLLALRARSGTAVLAVVAAGSILCAADVAARRQRRAATSINRS